MAEEGREGEGEESEEVKRKPRLRPGFGFVYCRVTIGVLVCDNPDGAATYAATSLDLPTPLNERELGDVTGVADTVDRSKHAVATCANRDREKERSFICLVSTAKAKLTKRGPLITSETMTA